MPFHEIWSFSYPILHQCKYCYVDHLMLFDKKMVSGLRCWPYYLVCLENVFWSCEGRIQQSTFIIQGLTNHSVHFTIIVSPENRHLFCSGCSYRTERSLERMHFPYWAEESRAEHIVASRYVSLPASPVKQRIDVHYTAQLEPERESCCWASDMRSRPWGSRRASSFYPCSRPWSVCGNYHTATRARGENSAHLEIEFCSEFLLHTLDSLYSKACSPWTILISW